jgi:large subunit ribosomal protein L21
MYAVIETGGKQYRVEVGTQLEVERLDAEAGSSIKLERVLLVADGDQAAIGRPLVTDAEVSAEVVRQGRGEKVIVFKYRPKARRRVKKGHRQDLTVLRISDIVFGGRSAAEDVRESEEAAQADRARLEEAAARQAAEDAALAAKLAARTSPKAESGPKGTARGRTKATKPAEKTGTGAAKGKTEGEPKASGGGRAARSTSAKATADGAKSAQSGEDDTAGRSTEAGSSDDSATPAGGEQGRQSKPRRKKDE